jgi:hypothetical protein
MSMSPAWLPVLGTPWHLHHLPTEIQLSSLLLLRCCIHPFPKSPAFWASPFKGASAWAARW